MATPVTTPTGADPFAGAPGVGTTPTGVPPTDAPVSSGMPTFVGGAGKTTFGVPTRENQPIGFPMGQDAGQGTIPNYVDGDQYKPGDNPDPDYVRDIQIQMVNAGIVKMSKLHLGLWDKASADAYAKVLAFANTSGMPASAALDQYVKSTAELPQKGLDPNDLKAIGNQAAQAVLGQNFTPEQLARFETAFNAGIAGGGPQTAAGLGQLAQDVATSVDPTGAQQNSLHAVSQRALNVLSNPAVSLPAVQA